MITDQEKVTLHQLMAKATCSGPDFDYSYLDTLIIIGQGMFWSQPLDKRAKDLAHEVNEEFKRQGQ